MKPWWRDTLFKRLAGLMCAALLGSHLVAWLVVTRVWMPWMHADPAHARGPADAAPPMPPLGSLPPTPGLPGAAAPPGPGPRSPADAPRGLPTDALVLDYAIRLLIIAAAAAWGARWLSEPVRRMVAAADALTPEVLRGEGPRPVDTRGGTAEVRDAGAVFDRMASRLAEEFRGRGLLMASISHDLRTPLTRMRIRVESMSPPLLARRCADDIGEMNALIDTAMDVFRDDGEAEPARATDIFALVQSLVDDLVEQGRPVGLQGQRIVARVQPQALRRAVSNLVGNALRHAGPTEVTVLTLDGVRILVDDRGPGIPETQLQDVLRPFQRVDPSRSRETGGAGLGLHIARDLLQRQGATLTLSNRVGGGLRAEIRLAPGTDG